MTTIRNRVVRADGTPVAGVRVIVYPVIASDSPLRPHYPATDPTAEEEILLGGETVTDAAGDWTMDVEPSPNLEPIGSVAYRVVQYPPGANPAASAGQAPGSFDRVVIVPDSGVALWVPDLEELDPDDVTELSALDQHAGQTTSVHGIADSTALVAHDGTLLVGGLGQVKSLDPPILEHLDPAAIGTLAVSGAWDVGTAYADRTLVTHTDALWISSGDTVAGEEPGVAAVWVEIPLPLEDYITQGEGDLAYAPLAYDAWRAARIAAAARTEPSTADPAEVDVPAVTLPAGVAGAAVDAEARAAIVELASALGVTLDVATPDKIADLHTWLNAEDLGLADGAAVTNWTDSSGNGNNVPQADAGRQPTYRTDGIGGLPAVDFDLGDFMRRTTDLHELIADGATVYVVGHLDTFPALTHLFDLGVTGTDRRNAYFASSLGTPWLGFLSPGGNYTKPATAFAVGVTGAPFVSSVRFGGAAPSWTEHNGHRFPEQTIGAGSTSRRLTLGADYNDAAGSIDGRIAEVIIYNRALTELEHRAVRRYLADRYNLDLAVPGIYHVSPTGHDDAAGDDPNYPTGRLYTALLDAATADTDRIVARIHGDDDAPFRDSASVVWNDARPLRIEPPAGDDHFAYHGTDVVTSGWTDEGGGVYSRAVAQDPFVVFVSTLEDPDDPDLYALNLDQQTTDLTAPAAGSHTWDAGTLRVRLPGDANPNAHTIEYATAAQAVYATGTGLVEIVRGRLRGWRTNAVRLSGTVGAGEGNVDLYDCDLDFGAVNGLYAFDYATRARAFRCRARRNANDGYNLHGIAGVDVGRMELYDCEGAYNGDEGASPHEQTTMVIVGGRYHHNRNGGGITGVGTGRMEITGAVVDNNLTDAAASTSQGGISFFDATMEGFVEDVIAVANNGPGVYVEPGADVRIERTVSGTAVGNANADVTP